MHWTTPLMSAPSMKGRNPRAAKNGCSDGCADRWGFRVPPWVTKQGSAELSVNMYLSVGCRPPFGLWKPSTRPMFDANSRNPGWVCGAGLKAEDAARERVIQTGVATLANALEDAVAIDRDDDDEPAKLASHATLHVGARPFDVSSPNRDTKSSNGVNLKSQVPRPCTTLPGEFTSKGLAP